MATLFKRNNGIWYIVFKREDRRHWISTNTKSYEEALRFFKDNEKTFNRKNALALEDLENEIYEYAKVNLSPGTSSLYSSSFRDFKRIIGNKALKLITARDIERFKQGRIKEVSPVTLNIQFRTLKAAFNRAVLWSYLETNPFLSCKQIKIPKREPSYISYADFRALLSSISDENFKELILVAVLTMMRLGEIVNLEYEDLDFTNKLIRIRNKEHFNVKGFSSRTIPMNHIIHDLLVKKEQISNYVFTNRNGEKLNPRSVSRKFKRYIRKHGLNERIHFHSLRHTGASWLIQQNVPLYDIQKLLGHSSPTVTQIYTHTCDDKLRDSIEKLSVNF